MNRFHLPAVLAALSTACATAASAGAARPEWIDGKPAKYSKALYLTGVGRADDRATAEARARGEIATIFSAQITSKLSNVQRETTATVGSASGGSSFQQTTAEVEQTSSKVLEGVQIAETWQDPADRTTYALAVLDKHKAGEAFLAKLESIDATIAQWKKRSGTDAASRIDRVRAAARMIGQFGARHAVEAELRIVDAGIPAAPVDEAAEQQELDRALSAMQVSVVVDGAGAGPLQSAVAESLSTIGLRASTAAQRESADLVVEGSVRTQPVNAGDPAWQMARSNVSLTIRDVGANAVLLQLDESDKGSATDPDTAARRSVVNAGKKASARLKQALLEILPGNTGKESH